MKILEYRAKEILRSFGIPTKQGKVAYTPEQAKEICKEFGGKCVVKSQVPVGGRGKAGGIKVATSEDDAYLKAKDILSMKIKGIPVKKVLVEEAASIDRELYVGFVVDRKTGKIVLMVSKEGGVEIEEVAKKNPKAIHKSYLDPSSQFYPFQAREAAFKLGLGGKLALSVASFIHKLYKSFIETDAQLAEINPLVIEKDGNVIALDAKILVDDNALFRRKNIANLRDMDYENKEELDAKAKGLSLVQLEGNIGCAVNGAGLAMATMDIIKRYGGEPANFLDVGGSSNPEKMKNAISIISSHEKVNAIFVNIFGGITRCDDIANGLINAFNELHLKIPLVVRLTGTNEEKGKEILKASNIPLVVVNSMREGAKTAISLARGLKS